MNTEKIKELQPLLNDALNMIVNNADKFSEIKLEKKDEEMLDRNLHDLNNKMVELNKLMRGA